MTYEFIGSKAAIVAAVLAGFAFPIAAAADDDTAAHAIAEKFAGATEEAKRKASNRKAKEEATRAEAQRQAAERLKSDEAEMLERARAEAAVRDAERQRAEDERRLAEDKARQEREAIAAAEAERRRLEDEHMQAEERLARDREEQRRAEERRALERQRLEEVIQLSEKLRRSREQREAEKAERDKHAVAAEPGEAPLDQPRFFSGPPVDREREEPARDAAEHALWPQQNVTILLVMQPGDRGIRRFEKSADPVLCIGARCYVGMGSNTPAKPLTRAAALGTVNTLGARAWGCRHSLTCVLRNVDLGADSASVQPIDLKIMRHDRRETQTVRADLSCEVDGAGGLHCANPVTTRTWRAWIVPESLAERAGPRALESALSSGLPDHRSALLR